MTPERWARIEQLYHAAAALPAADAERLLDAACAADPALREEIESLLRHGSRPHSILDGPAIEIMAASLAKDEDLLGARLRAGATISHYRIIDAIGAGGMGVVYLAEDLRLARRVALKFLPAYLAADRQSLERFRREAQAASALNHLNICTVYEIDEADGRPFIAIEYLEGETLKERLARAPMPLGELLRIGVEICNGLQAAHEGGIVHRDIKPANILLTRQGSVKILDFGAATRDSTTRDGMTRDGATPADEPLPPGAALGTAAYMSPEQATAGPVDARSDVYSLGIVLYEMAAGRLPFTGRTNRELLAAIRTEEAPSLAVANPRVPAALGRTIGTAMQKDPARRHQEIAQLRVGLQSLQHRLERAGGRRRTALLAASLLLLALGVTGAVRNDPRVRGLIGGAAFAARSPAIRSIAVLPFVNDGGGAGQDYLVDGMTDALIADLAKLGFWRVISGNSSMLYKDSRKPLAQIARELGVNALVTGKVARDGNRLRVSARLVEGSRARTLWGASYEREMSDVLRLQQDMAVALAYHASDRMSPEMQARLAGKARTVNAGAYDEFLRGSYFYDRETAGGFEKARQHFLRAIELDPGFAPAYAALGQNYSYQAYTNRLSPAAAYPEAETWLARALERDPDNPLAHVQMGMISLLYHCDLARAGREISRALALDPGDVGTLDYHSYYLLELGRYDEAIAEKRLALASDPLSVGTSAQVGLYLLRAGRNQEAIAQLRKTLELDPDHAPAWTRLGQAYANLGQYEQAIEPLRRGVASERFPPRLGALGEVYARFGKRAEALSVVRELQAMMPQRYVPPPLVALIYARLGERGPALQWLARAHAGDRPTVADPGFDSLRSDTRFKSDAARLAPTETCRRMF